MDGKEKCQRRKHVYFYRWWYGVSKKKIPSTIIIKVILIVNPAVKADTVVPLPCRHLPRVRSNQTDSGEGKKFTIEGLEFKLGLNPDIYDHFSHQYHDQENNHHHAQILISGGAPSWLHSSTISWLKVSISLIILSYPSIQVPGWPPIHLSDSSGARDAKREEEIWPRGGGGGEEGEEEEHEGGGGAAEEHLQARFTPPGRL